MKKLSLIASIFLSGFLFASCVSIPEPKDHTSTLLYGIAEYTGSRQWAGSDEPNITTRYDGIHVVIKHRKSNRSFEITSNSKGELIKRNLPEGFYHIEKIYAEYIYEEREWWCSCEPNDTDRSSIFKVYPGVTNLGKIKLNCDYSNNKYLFYFGSDFEEAKLKFRKNHSDSTWIKRKWTTTQESTQNK